MFQTFQIRGIIKKINKPIVYGPKYEELVFTVEYSSSAEYTYTVACSLSNTRLGMIKPFNGGDDVIVHFNLSSREAKGNYFTKVNVWKIDHQR